MKGIILISQYLMMNNHRSKFWRKEQKQSIIYDVFVLFRGNLLSNIFRQKTNDDESLWGRVEVWKKIFVSMVGHWSKTSQKLQWKKLSRNNNLHFWIIIHLIMIKTEWNMNGCILNASIYNSIPFYNRNGLWVLKREDLRIGRNQKVTTRPTWSHFLLIEMNLLSRKGIIQMYRQHLEIQRSSHFTTLSTF